MKAKLVIILMAAGSLLMAAAVSLFLYNQREQRQAAASVQQLMPQMAEAIQQRQEAPTEPVLLSPEEAAYREMPVKEIDGHAYIGVIGIEPLGLELPVMSDWTYPQLQIAPCRYSGSVYSDDLVVMAHNYPKHFGKLKELRFEDPVTFTDMDGNTVAYQVVALDVLAPEAVEEMTAGAYDLTLFTCTYGGENRVVLRCDRAEE